MQEYEPIWKRIGLNEPPSMNDGNNVGIIIIDDITPHSAFNHLDKRLVKVKVGDGNKVNVSYPALELVRDDLDMHGQLALQILSHPPFEYQNKQYLGLAPSAIFVFLSVDTPTKLRTGLEFLLERRMEWNLKLVLNFLVPDTQSIGFYRPTSEDPWVEAMLPAVKAGLLVIAANGNTKAHNNLHPIEYFTIGGYDDQGDSTKDKHKIHPSVPTGYNGDGHYRPDILVPFTQLPVPSIEKNSSAVFSIFEGSCGSSTVVAGFCAMLLSRFPLLDVAIIREAIVYFGDYSTLNLPVPKIVANAVLRALNDQSFDQIYLKSSERAPMLFDYHEHRRALLFSHLIKNQKLSRDQLWQSIHNTSLQIRKAAIFGLGIPHNSGERERYWSQFNASSYETGEKTLWLNLLLQSSIVSEIGGWIKLLDYNLIDISICVANYLRMHYPDAPRLNISSNPKIIPQGVLEVLEWYHNKFSD